MGYYSKFMVKLSEQIEKLNEKMDLLISIHSSPNLQIDNNILSLPTHLQETYLALQKLGKGSAEDVAQITGKERSIESAYLNQLVRLNKAYRTKAARRVIFQCRGAY